jgi:hypothetical protein
MNSHTNFRANGWSDASKGEEGGMTWYDYKAAVTALLLNGVEMNAAHWIAIKDQDITYPTADIYFHMFVNENRSSLV